MRLLLTVFINENDIISGNGYKLIIRAAGVGGNDAKGF